jgi:hypothetical protein
MIYAADIVNREIGELVDAVAADLFVRAEITAIRKKDQS